MDLIRSLSWISASHLRLVRDDDSYVDRLSHRYTVAVCIVFALIVSTKQYAGDPIDCWVPAQFKASYEKYADSYCWIAGSWYTPMEKELPLSERERRSTRIRYYQWVPFLLLFQAILCYIPRVVWRSLNVRSGLDIVNLVDASLKYESVDKFNDREKIMAYIVRNIERYIGARKSRYERLYGRQLCYLHRASNTGKRNQPPVTGLALCCQRVWLGIRITLSTMCFWTGKRLGNYLVVLYMFVKTMWLTNAVSQLFLLNRFIGNDYHAFGLEIIEMLLNGQEWHELRHFPRVTYCDFKIREIGNQHDWTVQCVLRINLFNEVIYIFMWFWLCTLAVITLVDYLTWTARILVPSDKLRFIKRHLDIYNYYLPSNLAKNQKTESMGQQQQQQQQQQSEPEYSNNFANLLNSKKAAATNPSGFEYVDVEKEKKLIREFTFKYLKDDGIFAMRILASSASDLIVTEIISELWRNFKLNYSDQAVQEAMGGDNLTLLSDSSVLNPTVNLANNQNINKNSSSSSSSTTSSSSASSPSSVQPPQPMIPKSVHVNHQTSPAGFVKKPFNYSHQEAQMKQYSPPSSANNQVTSIYSNSNMVKSGQQNAPPPLLKRESAGSMVPAPPNAPPPSVSFYGQPPLVSTPPPPPQQHSSDDYSTIKRSSGQSSSGGGRNNSIQHHNQEQGNQNAKDTHV